MNFYNISKTILRVLLKLANDYGGLPLVIGVVSLLIWIGNLVIANIVDTIQAVSDPTERGLCWVASAIMFKALLVRNTIKIQPVIHSYPNSGQEGVFK